MKKNLKQKIKEDISNSYAIEYDKELLHNKLVIKQDDNIKYNSKLKLVLKYAMVFIIGLVIGVCTYSFLSLEDNKSKILTNELKKEIEELGCDIADDNVYCFFKIKTKDEIYIFRSNEHNKYIYVIKKGSNTQDLYLLNNNKRVEIFNNSFGIISKNDDEEYTKFYIEIDGETQEFILN